jgi:hypothetical protein
MLIVATHLKSIPAVVLATLVLLSASWILFNREFVDTLEMTTTTDDAGYALTLAREVSLRCDELGINGYADQVRTVWKEFIGMSTE